ncbi:MAG: thioredoxin [Bacilli bacterium]|nr:thioredoxin [Bacilli bacterium]
MVKHLKEEDNFTDLISKGIHLVDFYAEWCGPCKMLAPVLETLEDIDIIKVNTDEFPLIAREYGVMSIPTLVYIKNGEVKLKEIGFRTKDEIITSLNSIK